MKGLKLLLAVCLAPLTFGGAMADDNADVARAAVRRTSNNAVTVTRQKTSEPTTSQQSISRATNLSAKQNTASPTDRERITTTGRGDTNTVQSSGTPRSQSVTTRVSASPSIRTRTASTPVQSRAATTTSSRSATTRANASTPRVVNTARTASTRATLSRAATKNVARATDTTSVVTARTELMSHDAKKCREVYYSCMDEFCANKDAVLKRCACSARIREFDSTKKNLANVEDKMLEFNQRLLTVNMDKEDAEALYKATEGELAFNQKDTSQSKKMLDEIAKKLNTSFDDSNFDRSLSPISLSLNVDAAFDNIDSMQGAATTLKTGTELYTAALPVCREMAREVCTDDDLTIAESGYQMIIEQDCNTVAKSYQAQTDQARERVREGGALLDMSRLDIHQKRNSDDTLTCKKKMLDMLTDSSVCGSDMGKCLDITGQYIDPSTGQAILTTNLVKLNESIIRPTGDETWTSIPKNNEFVTFLNSKKKFLAPAMENCQDIADTVWSAFIEDALAQIKLAQESKLEDMRQSCTALTTQCLSDTAKSLADFDARALSIFGVKADKTVTAMCADVTNACTALLKMNKDGNIDNTDNSAGNDWVGGMTEIANANTYETILNTCREVGRACIVQVCSSISGNFGLCESIQSSVNRKSIINRTACWSEVYNCVAEAGEDKIDEIMVQLGKSTTIQDIRIPILLDTGLLKVPQTSRAATLRNTKNINMSRASNTNHVIQWDTSRLPTLAGNQKYEVIEAENGKLYAMLKTVLGDFYDEVYNTLPRDKTLEEPNNQNLYIAADGITACTTQEIKNTADRVSCILDMCSEDCDFTDKTAAEEKAQLTKCKICRITEQIWGNCEANPKTSLTSDAHNKILQPKDDVDTLLWWFAKNTGTSNELDSCRDTTCPAGYASGWSRDDNQNQIWTCVTADKLSITQEICSVSAYTVDTATDIRNCCPTNIKDYTDTFEHCLSKENLTTTINSNDADFNDDIDISNTTVFLPATNQHKVVATWHLSGNTVHNGATYPDGDYALICAGAANTNGADATTDYPNGKTITCNGTYVIVNTTHKLYFTPGKPENGINYIEASNKDSTECHYSLTSKGWVQTNAPTEKCPIENPSNWRIKYSN